MKSKILVLALIVFAVACANHESHEAKAVSNQIKEGEKNYTGVSVSSVPHTESIKTYEVTIDGQTFMVPERTASIKSFPCSDCHTKPVEQLQSGDLAKAHWDVQLDHAGEDVMNCMTCHNTDNMDMLHSSTGSAIDFNQSFMLCGQCHSPQYKDWLGGGHGKRLESWAPPRVSNTCTNCHNPHKPSFKHKKRWPSRYNTTVIEERK